MKTPELKTYFLTPQQLAQRWSVCALTLRRWRQSGKIKAHHLGRGIRFSMEEVERIEAESRVGA